MNTPTILVVFGATGDLMARKIVPSLYYLFSQDQLPAMCSVIGFSRQELSNEQFQQQVKESLQKNFPKFQKSGLDRFLGRFSYQAGVFEDKKGYGELARRLGHLDRESHACSNKLFYLAVAPEHYETIFKNLAEFGLSETCGPGEEGWTRILIEKPFGHDLVSAKKLDAVLAKYFNEDQIYRIDHYLAKEMIQGIINFRFSNKLFEPQWNNQSIESIDIYLNETIGVEKRGGFYDKVGALKDVGQNHLLQMLALVTMDHPGTTMPDDIRAKRAQVLGNLMRLPDDEIQKLTFRAQYKGYQKIKGVARNSQTETYFRVPAKLDHPRWHGVPITLSAGKRLKTVRKEIVVIFKHPTPCLMCAPGKHFHNKVIFTLEPQETISIEFWAKKPGQRTIERRRFNFFLYEKKQKLQYVEEYSKLLLDAMVGDQTLFVSSVEVEAMWRFVDPIVAAWRKNKVPLGQYQPDTDEVVDQAEKLVNQFTSRQLGMVGLGKMGANLSRQLLDKGWQVEGYDVGGNDLKTVQNLKEMVAKLKTPRVIWLMVPQGKPVDETIDKLVSLLSKGDTIIDGGNSFYKDTIRRFKRLAGLNINYVDVGVSGGPEGARAGASLMVGGKKAVYEKLLPLFQDLAVPEGAAHFEGAGAGHFVKMVHNGIEYGMMQALAEGFAILKNSSYKLDLKQVARVYNHGSVIESRLVNWLYRAFEVHGQDLKNVSGKVAHTGEGRWTVETAKEMKLKVKIIEEALKFRVASQKNPSYTGKVLSALREQFGGHKVT